MVREGPGHVHLGGVEFEDRGDDVAHPSLGLGARGARPLGAAGLVRQRGAVQLAVGRDRHLLHHGDAARHLVGGQQLSQPLAQHRGIQHGAVVRGDPRDEVACGVAAPHVHRAGGDAGQGLGRGLRLPRLHAHAADLQLAVAAAAVDEPVAGFPAHEVARAVHPLAGALRVRDERRGGAPRHSHVAVREPVPGEVELPHGALGHLAEGGVQHRGARVAHGAAQARRGALLDGRAERVDRELGGPVEVVAAHARRLAQQRPQLLRHGLTAQQHEPRVARPLEQAVAEQLPGVGRGHVDHVDPHPVVVRHELRGLQPQPVVHHVHLVPVEHPEQLLPGHVEREVHGVGHAQPLAQSGHGGLEDLGGVVVVHRGQPAVTHEHALRPARGAGRVDHVGRLVRVRGAGEPVLVHGRGGHGAVEHGAHRGVVEVDDGERRVLCPRHLVPVPAADQTARVGVREQLRGALDRLLAVQRQVGRARAHDREDRHDVVRRARQADAHHVTAADPAVSKHGGEALHPLVHLTGVPPHVPAHEARALR